jgi:methylenetetrahydrofolate dehydrogenase (NADP+)/methenyltetrahydrofolate cyclohydrolase
MNSIVIDGKKIATEITAELKKKPVPKGFVAVFVRKSNQAADSFVKQKEKTARELGIEVRRYDVYEDDTNDSLRKRVRMIANTKRCIGVVLQLPLPEICDPLYIANTIPSDKDLDCLGARCAGALYQKKSRIVSPAVRVVQRILESQGKVMSDFSSVAIVGQGILVGKPIGVFCSGVVTHCAFFDKGFNKSELKNFDLVILGTGSAGLVSGADIKKGGWVIDFGYGELNGKISGDFDFNKEATEHIELYTPTPGGTGPILVASLFENLYRE